RRYLAALDSRAVAPSPEALAALARFDGPLPERASSPDRVLAELDELGSPATVASAGRRYFGFVTGGSLPVTVAASWLASAWDQNAGLVACSPIGAKLEQVALDWLKDLFHLPRDSGGARGRAPRPAGTRRLGRRGPRPVWRAADHRRGRRGSARERAEGPLDGRSRARAGRARALRRSGAHAPGEDAANHRAHHRVRAGRQREYRCLRSRRRDLRARPQPRGVGTRRWCLRTLGRRCSGARAPRQGHRKRRLLGDRCPQVAERSL